MPEITKRIGLKKPLGTENFNRASYSENLDILEVNVETVTGAQSKVDAHANKKDNPHAVTKAQIGLSNVDNVKQATKAEFDAFKNTTTSQLADIAINVKLFGAKGDGVTDDYTIIQSLINSHGTTNPIYFPPGSYLLSAPLHLVDGLRLYGAGFTKTTLLIRSNINAIETNTTSESGVYFVTLTDFSIDGEGVGNMGMDVSFLRESLIRDVRVRYFDKGIYFDDSWSNQVESCSITDNRINLHCEGATNDINFINCKFDLAKEVGVHFDGDGSPVNFIGCVIQSCGHHGILVDHGRAINIEYCYFEQNNLNNTGDYYDIYLRGDSRVILSSSVKGCTFFPVNEQIAIKVDRVRGLSVENCSFASRYTFTKRIVTTERTEKVISSQLISNRAELNDVDDIGAIDDMTNLIFKHRLKVKYNNAHVEVDTVSENQPARYVLSQAGVGKHSILLNNDGSVSYSHYNIATSQLESYLRVIGNTLQWKSFHDFEGRNLNNFTLRRFTTSARPTNPYLGQTIIDIPTNKIIHFDGTNWRDAMGTII